MGAGVYRVLPGDAGHEIPVPRAPLVEGGARVDGAAVAAREVVEDRDLLARREELLHEGAADVAGAAGHENGHSRSPCW